MDPVRDTTNEQDWDTVLERIHREFYDQGRAKASAVASSHWSAFAARFAVGPELSSRTKARGYGFGDCDQGGPAARILSRISTTVHHAFAPIRGLSHDIRTGRAVTRRMGLIFSQDAFRQTCTLQLLKQFADARTREILIIGDGYGVLAALLAESFPESRITLIDLGAVLFFQVLSLSRAFPDRKVALSGYGSKNIGVEATASFRFIPAESLSGQAPSFAGIDLAVNIASMQEMNPDSIAMYFNLLRRNNTELFYSCNRLEKKLPDGTISAFFDYPWSTLDRHLLDELCPWHQWFIGPPVFGVSNVRLAKLKIPLAHRYDGPHWHRLTQLSNMP